MEHDREDKQDLLEELKRLRQRVGELEATGVDRKQSKQPVGFERDKLYGVFEVMADGVYVCSEDHEIEYINPALTGDFGPVDGRKCFEYFHGRRDVCPWCKMPDVQAGRSGRWELHSPGR